MIQLTCDLCKKEIPFKEKEYNQTLFSLPAHRTYNAENRGVKIMSFDRIETVLINLCPSCQHKIADILANIGISY